jgi:pyruvate ferredoxin oxidoreductase alpha subunit
MTKKNSKSKTEFVKPSFAKHYETTKPLSGAYAVSEAMRQIDPDVVAAYPITPQTPIVERFSQFVADGKVKTEFVPVESEHSAMSAVVGASAAGARAMTATSSVGLALMFEVVNAASGMRLPIVMPVVNRALSSPINIHCDHSDTMACRDAGWIQLYSENPQEAYEHTILAIRLAEHKDIQLPVMIAQDGFITSHAVENVSLLKDKVVRKFIGKRKPIHSLLLSKKPVTFGALELPDYFFETKRQQQYAMEMALKHYDNIAKELSELTGNNYPMFEQYRLGDAEAALIALNSSAGTIKKVVDEMRKEGKKVGLLKIRLFRPFNYSQVSTLLRKIPNIGVLDRSYSFGANPPVYSEILSALPSSKSNVFSFVYGLGGRELYESQIRETFEKLLKGKIKKGINHIGLRE